MAGYDPRAALDLWELMRCVEEDAAAAGQAVSVENRFALLRTHPTSEVRSKALEKDMESAMRLWREKMPTRKKAAEIVSTASASAGADGGSTGSDKGAEGSKGDAVAAT